MKHLLILLTLLIIGLSSKAQYANYRTDVDTIGKYPDKILVHYKSFKDSVVVEDAEAYLYPVIIKVPRFKMLGNLLLSEIPADSIVFHGRRTTYLSNRYYQVADFDNGNLIKSMYFNSVGVEITEEEYVSRNTIRGPEIIGSYIITGTKEK
jgi:hypothetical protein